MKPSTRTAVGLAGCLLLAGCETATVQESEQVRVTRPRDNSRSATTIAGTTSRTSTVVSTTPAIPVANADAHAASGKMQLPSDPPIEASVDQMPLPAFAAYVFGDLLKVPYELDARIASRSELVTLRSGGPRRPEEIFDIVEQSLAAYGLRVMRSGPMIRIVPDEGLTAQIPEVVRSKSSGGVPTSVRPVIQYIPITSTRATDIMAWLQDAFGQKTKLIAASDGNAILALGQPANVRAVVEAAHLFDQPRFAGSKSIRITPAYWTASKLADQLVEALRAEGYSAATRAEPNTAITVLPITPLNALLLFAADSKVLNHAVEWARQLDHPLSVDQNGGIFVYRARNTGATDLARVAGQVVGSPVDFGVSSAGAAAITAAASANDPGTQSPSGARTAESGSGNKIIVDQKRNALIFRGSGEEWGKLLSLMESLDVVGREVLVDVTVAEVTLDEQSAFGIEWGLKNGLGSGLTTRYGTISSNAPPRPSGGLGLGNEGFNLTIFNSVGDLRAVLNAFARDNRISILSSPRVLARDGTEARIEVGTDVPIVTSQGTTNINRDGDPAILQSIQYRKTGVILVVKPTVHASDRVELEISQEVSQPQLNNTSSISSPLILSRKLATGITLRDGATVLLGGLISENRSATRTGVPLLKDIPVLGNLFRNDSVGTQKTELLVLITPHVVDSDDRAEEVTEIFKQRLRLLDPDVDVSGEQKAIGRRRRQ